MTCDQAELRMAELLAGEISPAERSALDQHLLDCSTCRGDFEVARVGARLEWADVPLPKDLIEATLAAFREPPVAVRFLRWATAAAAVFAVATLLLTSSRAPKLIAPAAPGPVPERREVLATMQDAVVGALACKDEDGRPVGELGLKSHEVSVEILDGIAKTTVEENFENHTDRRLEGTFTFPLPSDASISRLALEVNGKIEEGTCLERERAREVFESIVRRMQDPALLEWQPGGFFKCRVFPIEPRATKRVIVAYTQALPCFRGKMTYVYPLASEKTRTHPPEEVRISLQARFSGALTTIESPSHRLDVQRKSAGEASMSFRATNYRPNNDFVVTMEPADEELRVVSQRPAGEDGYFACILTPRGAAARAPGRYAFVLDASASISAPRLEVARRLVRAMMERRIPGDRFEILTHNIDVERSGEVDLRAANDFMDRLRPIGGSDVLKALQAAPADAELIYIGKGSPTFGESDPGKILDAVKGRRIRTIAVGSDANGLLLEKLGGMMRVNPNDDMAKRVEEIAATIGSPLLSELKVEGEGVSEIVGARDLFYGERVVVSGRYRDGASKLLITGRGGYRREVEVAFPAKEEGNNYVRRLWAQRKVADLLARGESTKAEVTALGVQYQIMTPYTSFLVLENEQMWKDHQLKREVQKQDQVLGKLEEEKKRLRVIEEEKARDETKLVKPVVETPKPQDLPAVAKTPAPPPPAVADPTPARPTTNQVGGVEFLRNGERAGRSTEIPDNEFDGYFMLPTLAGFYDGKPSGDTTVNDFAVWASTFTDAEKKQGGWRGEYQSVTALQKYPLVGPTQGGGGPLTGATFPLEQADMNGLARANQIRNAPIAGEALEIENQRAFMGILQDRINILDTENSAKAARIDDLQRKLLLANTPRNGDDLQSSARQLEMQLTQIQELTTKVDEHRAKLSKALNEKSLAVAELQYARLLGERLQQDLGQLEEKYVEMARDKKHLEEKINAIAQAGGSVNTVPKKALEAKVTAVANEIGLVVISIGKNDGVLEGDEFTVYRGGDFVAKIVIDRSDRKWSAGKVVLKKTEPRVADDVSNHIFVSAPQYGSSVLAEAAVATSDIFAVTRASKFVALVRVRRGAGKEADVQVLDGLALGRVLPGDQMTPISDVRGYVQSLPAEVRMDLASRANQQSIRAKMGMKQ